jgi:ABC-type Na+ efflux pump permease subunit
MRKYIIAITIVLIILLAIVFGCIYYAGLAQKPASVSTINPDELIASMTQLELSAKDTDSLVNELYSDSINKIIGSLESGKPVILYVEGGIFDKDENGNYITLSAFDTNGKVIVYEKKDSAFSKVSADFNYALEAASSAFIFTNEEILS